MDLNTIMYGGIMGTLLKKNVGPIRAETLCIL